jgi:flavin reductase (DIM6/NTAB) family NADH-FMN oxidoreductase RutF
MDTELEQEGTVTFDFRAISARDRYKLMIGTIVPRPIASVTTIDPAGRVNAARFRCAPPPSASAWTS